MKTGIELIAAERDEQINKHGHTLEKDIETNSSDQLVAAAHDLICGPDPNDTPKGWDKKVWEKLCTKNHTNRLIIAGALIAAELDRVNELRRLRDEKRAKPDADRFKDIDDKFAARAMLNGGPNMASKALFDMIFGSKAVYASAQIGKWFELADNEIVFITDTMGPFAKGYAFTKEGFGQGTYGINPMATPKPASEEKVSDAAFTEARKNGYFGGVKVKALPTGATQEINPEIKPVFHLDYLGTKNVMFVGGACVFLNGRWAEIVK